jgi:hypothetical protein
LKDLKAQLISILFGVSAAALCYVACVDDRSDVNGAAQLLLLEIIVVAFSAPFFGLLSTLEGSRRKIASRVLLAILASCLFLSAALVWAAFLSFGLSLLFQMMVLGYGLGLFFGTSGLTLCFKSLDWVLMIYAVVGLVMTFPLYGSAFIEALPGESQAAALSMSLQMSPLFIVSGTFLEMDVLVSERLYLAFPVGQQWPYTYATPARVTGLAWMTAALSFAFYCLPFWIAKKKARI